MEWLKGSTDSWKRHWKLQPNPAAWVDTLPLVLFGLGIWTALKEDLSANAAEMVYGTTLRLPEFFQSSDD